VALIIAGAAFAAPAAGGDTADSAESTASANPDELAIDYVRQHAASLGVSAEDVSDVFVLSSYTSQHTGVTHVNLLQRYRDLEVFGGHVTVNVTRDGGILYVGSNLVDNLREAAAEAADLDAVEAVEAAADALELDEPENLRVMRTARTTGGETTLTRGGISDEPITAKLGWQPTDDGLRLAWQLVIDDSSDDHLWNATIDAASGEMLDVDDWTSDSNHAGLTAFLQARGDKVSSGVSATRISAADEPRTDVGPVNPVDDGSIYRILQIPSDSPNDGPPVLVTNPAEATASPFGWHDTDGDPGPEFTITRGNNVYAYFDQDSGQGAGFTNTPDPGFEVDGGPDLTFDFDADLTEHAQNYRDQDLVNLFYWCNVIHDVMYGYGFNEESGNFQATNYTGQGVGGDAVNCEGADGGGTNNANFATPAADGGAPRMQMFLWPGNQFGSQNQLVIDGVGAFGGNFARFSAAPTNAGLSGEIVDAGNGCDAAQYPATLPDGDWIALVATGTCNNVVKGQVAQAQGASAAVVTGTTAILTGPITLPRVEIPMMSLSTADGDTVRAALPVTGTVRKHPDHPGIRSGDLDNGIIIHEYGHGISNRLVGGPGINCIGGDERMGEGWSDYYAITMLIDPELDDFDGPRGLVPYSLFQPNRQGNGLRPRPYSRTWDIQPFSYDSIKTGGWLGGASLAAPHGIGHGWNSVLMDMTWDLIDKHGFNPNLYEPWHTGGNNLAMQLVTDGLKIQGCNPTFVVGRDAILAADQALTGGENQCTIWASFARRGLGYSADDGGTTGRNDGTEAFDTHPDCASDFAGSVTAQPAVNTVAAGRTVPMMFDRPELSGTDVLAPPNSPFSRRVDCETFAVPSDDPPRITPRAAPVAAMTAGDSSLTRSTNGRYTFPWQTEEAWVDTCREFVLTLQNGEQHRAYFRFVEAE
jgi:hypothetical protein